MAKVRARRSGTAPKSNRYDLAAASAMRILRFRHPPMDRFASDLGAALGRSRFSRQAIYDWEAGRARIPASVLMAAADLVGVPVEAALQQALSP